LEDLGEDGRILFKWILKIGWEGVDWIHLDEDMAQWLAFVNMTVNLRVP
jgi:hypothetical protein